MKKVNLREICEPYKHCGVVYAFSTSDDIVYIGSTYSLYNRISGHNSLTDKNSLRSKSGKKTKHFNLTIICCTKDRRVNIRKLEQRAIDEYIKLKGRKPLYNSANSYYENPSYKYLNTL